MSSTEENGSSCDVFGANRPISLADVLLYADEGLVGTARRDTLSAFRVLEAKAGVKLASVSATPAGVRSLFESISGRATGFSPKRLANIRSLVSAAVDRFGARRTWITQEIPPDANWQMLLSKVHKHEYRWSLSRLACYCTVKNIPPEDVCPETLRGLCEALEGECVVTAPRKILKQTITAWNSCRRNVPTWPQITLSSPFKTEPYMMPLSAFPERFRADIANWEARMLNADPLDPDAPLRAMRPATLEGYRFAFRRLASSLVRQEIIEVGEVTGLDILCRREYFTKALRKFLPNGSEGKTAYMHKMAIQMRHVAEHFLKLPPEILNELDKIIKRIAPRNGRSMGQRNRSRLSQFDDARVVQRLLRFPEEEYGRALALKNIVRRAKGIERALAISLLIHTGIRVKNLRNLRLDQNIQRRGGRVFVSLADHETKTWSSLELELPGETIRLLDAFLEIRGKIEGSNGPFLFPAPNGTARSYSAMREAVSKPLLKHAGIKLSPHLYRHIIAKIVAEREPGMLSDVSRMLDHKSMNTTYQSYLGTETPAASRRINDLLEKVQARPEIGRDR